MRHISNSNSRESFFQYCAKSRNCPRSYSHTAKLQWLLFGYRLWHLNQFTSLQFNYQVGCLQHLYEWTSQQCGIFILWAHLQSFNLYCTLAIYSHGYIRKTGFALPIKLNFQYNLFSLSPLLIHYIESLGPKFYAVWSRPFSPKFVILSTTDLMLSYSLPYCKILNSNDLLPHPSSKASTLYQSDYSHSMLPYFPFSPLFTVV